MFRRSIPLRVSLDVEIYFIVNTWRFEIAVALKRFTSREG